MIPYYVDRALRGMNMVDELTLRQHLIECYARIAAAEETARQARAELAQLRGRVTAPAGWHATLVLTPEAVAGLAEAETA